MVVSFHPILWYLHPLVRLNFMRQHFRKFSIAFWYQMSYNTVTIISKQQQGVYSSMLKRISCLALSMILVSGICVQQVTALENSEVSEQQTAILEGPSIFVDGVAIETEELSTYEQTTYVSLRGVTMALRPDATVTWDGDHATVTADGLSITVYPNEKYMVANGRYLYLPHGARFINNCTMVPVRELVKALGAQVWWDSTDGSIYITSGTGAIVSGRGILRLGRPVLAVPYHQRRKRQSALGRQDRCGQRHLQPGQERKLPQHDL